MPHQETRLLKSKTCRTFFYTLLLLGVMLSSGQSLLSQIPLSLSYEAREARVPTLQSYAVAQMGDSLLLVGGRKDGLHQRQPSFAFDSLSRNDSLWLYDVSLNRSQGLSTATLPADIAAQLSSTNTEFVHRGDYLYVAGGYGYDPSTQEHRTFDQLIALHIPSILTKLARGLSLDTTCYYRIQDELFAVTGGVMHEFDGHIILACGHRFDGLYNPVDNPTFIQKYHEKIVELEIDDDKRTYTVLSTLEDSLLHRRDLSSSVIHESDGDKLVLFAGVFRRDINFPYQNILEYQNKKLSSVTGFRQCLSTYHTAKHEIDLSTIDPQLSQATIFVGGLAPYYLEDTTLCYDTDVPFVSTISMVTQDSQGKYQEWLSKSRLPTYLGTGSYWIPTQTTPVKHEDKKQHLGYFLGGIASGERNVFWSAEDSPSVASQYLVDIYLEPCPEGWELLDYANSEYQIDIFPDREYTYFTCHWNQGIEDVLMEVYTLEGQKLFGQNYSSDRYVRQSLVLPTSLMEEKVFMFHFKGKKEYWIKVLNND